MTKSSVIAEQNWPRKGRYFCFSCLKVEHYFNQRCKPTELSIAESVSPHDINFVQRRLYNVLLMPKMTTVWKKGSWNGPF